MYQTILLVHLAPCKFPEAVYFEMKIDLPQSWEENLSTPPANCVKDAENARSKVTSPVLPLVLGSKPPLNFDLAHDDPNSMHSSSETVMRNNPFFRSYLKFLFFPLFSRHSVFVLEANEEVCIGYYD